MVYWVYRTVVKYIIYTMNSGALVIEHDLPLNMVIIMETSWDSNGCPAHHGMHFTGSSEI